MSEQDQSRANEAKQIKVVVLRYHQTLGDTERLVHDARNA